MSTVTAIYENGVFRPLEKVDLPEHARVEIPLPSASEVPSSSAAALDAVYAAMDFHFRSGCGDLAARHNEHQP